MGLVEKVHEDRDQRLIVESAEELARQRDEHDREERCLVLVTTSLQTTAAGLQEPLEEVDEGALGTPSTTSSVASSSRFSCSPRSPATSSPTPTSPSWCWPSITSR